ncbi:polysaccharide pyruvyl transferase family protein [Methanosarcina sp. T3]|uniref:polysaccharide pyruvyl transferase family protein n=1 Tax=Methanosarcina sp. T3 TaxID=3439062 RepID=UPI003F85FC2B
MKDKKPNLLILNAHWNNRGDEAAIRAMIDSIESKILLNKIEIMILSRNVTQFPYKNIPLIKPYPLDRIDYLDSLISLFTLGTISFTENGRRFHKSVNEADIVIHAPGGPAIGDMYGGKVADYEYLYRLLIATLKGKPTYFYAPSMGPFTNRYRNKVRKYILKKAKLITVREEISAKYLKKQLGLDSYVTIDSALQNNISEDHLQNTREILEVMQIIKNKNVIGLTITDLKWHPLYKDNKEFHEQIKKSIFETIEYLINKGYFVLLIPQLFGEQNDINLLNTFKKIDEKNISILPENLDSYAQQIIISKLYCVIGMRYHSNIFAAKGNVPFISIYYEHKMKGFMQNLGLDNLMIDVKEITSDKIKDKFVYLEQNHNDVKKYLTDQMPELKNRSRKTTELFMENIGFR